MIEPIAANVIAAICMVGFLYLSMISFLMSTKNFVSFFIFKLFPFFLAIAQLVVALKLWGIV